MLEVEAFSQHGINKGRPVELTRDSRDNGNNGINISSRDNGSGACDVRGREISQSKYGVKLFDELSNRLLEDHEIRVAILEWGVYPGILYRACHSHGFDRVRGMAREVRLEPGIRHRGKVLVYRLNRLEGIDS